MQHKRITHKIDREIIWKLFSSQSWLMKREESLISLLEKSESREEKELLADLLARFSYVGTDQLDYFLRQIAHFITNEIGVREQDAIVVAMTFDDESDSGQKLLDYIKTYLYEFGWKKVQTLNRVNNLKRWYEKGYTKIIIIDEFVGTGKTVRNRFNTINKDLLKGHPVEIHFCLLAGMKSAIEQLRSEGISIFCPIQLDRGISDYYSGDSLGRSIMLMEKLEYSLAERIGEKELSEFSFGYGRSEALYALERTIGNTPNNVFPIFWWPKDRESADRDTVLIRFQMDIG